MSPQLKPLLLPQLVEERKFQEQQQLQHQQSQLQLQLQHQQQVEGADQQQYAFYTYNSSSSDLASASPVTPTFSRASSHPRYSTSSSSLDISDNSPASPTQPTHVTGKPSKSPLPDVQEDPLEREEDGGAMIVQDLEDGDLGWYGCLCDSSCSCAMSQSATMHPYSRDFDYDLGSLSDGDFNGSPRLRKRRQGSDAGFSGWSTRIGTRLQNLPRWRSSSTSRRMNLSFSPGSDPALAEQRPRASFSRAASSRSSSVSAPAAAVARVQEASLPATPALSYYESTESIVSPPSPRETSPLAFGKSLERDRVMATTPLLPPLMTANMPSHTQPQSLQPSPLQSPTIVPSPVPELPLSLPYPTPPLSAKASYTSLRRGTISSTFNDIPSPVLCILDNPDSWADRLGHANFTIEPKPYVPEKADLATFQAFRSDWNLARTNYAKHLVRTGEHYGATSKTYALTEAKWVEIEQSWQRAEEDLVRLLAQSGNGDSSVISHLRRTTEEMLPATIPRMLSDHGKFPELGDLEIVGPMMRDSVMARDGQTDEKRSASVWLKNLAEKVGLRK
ncbi:hypothetical protein QBC35DRAFT_67139 [Podospora australis]|uniref:Only prolin and serin are matching in the corresponding protein n=1 Tax=Podospora australis TaxID=1536484 RepID=A0AAN6WMN8_9PEZI|nr:hypothetical protein QBC35DRAFT_67139 [Podospora australis]